MIKVSIKTDYRTYDVSGYKYTAVIGEYLGSYPVSIRFSNLDLPINTIALDSTVTIDGYTFRVGRSGYWRNSYFLSGLLDYALIDLVKNFSITKGKKLSDTLKSYVTCNAIGNDQVLYDYQVPHAVSLKEVLHDLTKNHRWYWVWNNGVEIVTKDQKDDSMKITDIYDHINYGVTDKMEQEVYRSKVLGEEIASQRVAVIRIPIDKKISLLEKVEGKVSGVVHRVTTVLSSQGNSYRELYVLQS